MEKKIIHSREVQRITVTVVGRRGRPKPVGSVSFHRVATGLQLVVFHTPFSTHSQLSEWPSVSPWVYGSGRNYRVLYQKNGKHR